MSNIYSSQASPNIFNTDGSTLTTSKILKNTSVYGVIDTANSPDIKQGSFLNQDSLNGSRNAFVYTNSVPIDTFNLNIVFSDFYQNDDCLVDLLFTDNSIKQLVGVGDFVNTSKNKLAKITAIRDVPADILELQTEAGENLLDEDGGELDREDEFSIGTFVTLDIEYDDLSACFEPTTFPFSIFVDTAIKNNAPGEYIAIGLPNTAGDVLQGGAAYQNNDSNINEQIRSNNITALIKEGKWGPIEAEFSESLQSSTFSIGNDQAAKENQVTILLR